MAVVVEHPVDHLPAAFVHPTADIEAEVTIGVGSRVWAHSHLRRGARIGTECNVGERVFIDAGVAVGDRCKIQNNALLYLGSAIGDDVFIGPAVCLTNDRLPRASGPDGQLKAPADWLVSGVIVERGASLGAGCVVVAGTRVGAWSLAGSGAVVTRDIPAHALVFGNPARQHGWVCKCGTPLDASLHCLGCGLAYQEGGAGLRDLGDASR